MNKPKLFFLFIFFPAIRCMTCQYLIKLFFSELGFFFQIFWSCSRDAICSIVPTQAHHCSRRITTELRILRHFLEWQIATNQYLYILEAVFWMLILAALLAKRPLWLKSTAWTLKKLTYIVSGGKKGHSLLSKPFDIRQTSFFWQMEI